MYTLFLLALAVLASNEASVVRRPSIKEDLSAGHIHLNDILLCRTYAYKPAMINSIQYQDVTYRGNDTTKITAIQANEIGYTQYGSVMCLSGGIGYNNVTVRFKSAWGYGFYYVLDIWGK